MAQPASLHLDESAQPPCLQASGDWTLANFETLEKAVDQARGKVTEQTAFDLTEIKQLDTAGAAFLADLLGSERLQELSDIAADMPEERRALLVTVGQALDGFDTSPAPPGPNRIIEFLIQVGRAMTVLWDNVIALLNFIGLTLQTLFRSLFQPSRWRVTSLVANIEQSGLNAVPIIALLTFLVGAVVAFLGATVLADFGATLYTIDLVVYSFMREFAVLLTAILMAGRTASAFTAQIGSMKSNEEIDAIKALGLNPIELLVLPRVLALLISLPMLTFIGMICGIIGGMVVCALSLDIPPTMFLSIVKGDVEIRHFLVGLGKAPIFAFLIAVIGCMEGFKVTGSSTSVGEHTTTSVVHSIFVVILLDAIAALFFMEMGW